MVKSAPLVSVITTAYNVAPYIGEAVDSVLAQDFVDFEYIIVDDASDDETPEVVSHLASRDRRIKVHRNERNLGDYLNRRRSADLARGEYIKFVDADNYIYPHALSVMVRCMGSFPDAGLGLCKVHGPLKPLPDCLDPLEAYRLHFMGSGLFTNAPTSAILRRDCYNAVGGFRNIRHRGDLDLWLRMGAVAATVRIPAYLDWDRIRPGQESQKNTAAKAWITYDVVRDALSFDRCPLSASEKQIALKRYRHNFELNIIRRVLRGELSLAEYCEIRARTGMWEPRVLAGILWPPS